MDPRLNQLAELEKIFQEFYDPFLSNQRKTQLGMWLTFPYGDFLTYSTEQIIAHVKSLPDSWSNARYYISNSNNQYILFCAVTIYEDILRNGKWESLPLQDQVDIRNLLFDFLIAKYKV